MLVQQWHPLTYERQESINKTWGQTFLFFFYKHYNTSDRARITNNQRVKRKVQQGVALLKLHLPEQFCLSLKGKRRYWSIACSSPSGMFPLFSCASIYLMESGPGGVWWNACRSMFSPSGCRTIHLSLTAVCEYHFLHSRVVVDLTPPSV